MVDTSRGFERTSRSGGFGGVAAALWLTAFAAFGSPAYSAIGPRIETEQREIDLGDVVKGDVVEARFELRNSGDEVLQIIRVKPG